MQRSCNVRARGVLRNIRNDVDWTGKRADALRRALGMTYEDFAEELGVGVRTVAYWRSRPGCRIREPRALARLHDTLSADQRRTMASLLSSSRAEREAVIAATREHLVRSKALAVRVEELLRRSRGGA